MNEITMAQTKKNKLRVDVHANVMHPRQPREKLFPLFAIV